MAVAPVFDRVCAALERETSLSRLEARGTVRLALRSAGLEAEAVTAEQMRVVLARVLPGELTARGISDAGAACRAMAAGLEATAPGASRDTPEAIFGRLGSR